MMTSRTGRKGRASLRGQLLMEAVVATVVLGTGLAFLGRGVSSQLHALRVLDEHRSLLALAQGRLELWEYERLHGGLLPLEREGIFEPPHQVYRWQVAATRRSDGDAHETFGDVTLMVQRIERPSAQLHVVAVWPERWIPDAWWTR